MTLLSRMRISVTTNIITMRIEGHHATRGYCLAQKQKNNSLSNPQGCNMMLPSQTRGLGELVSASPVAFHDFDARAMCAFMAYRQMTKVN